MYKSHSPNKLVAKIFKEAGIIEEYGSGVKKVMNIFWEHWLSETIIDILQWFITYICYKNKREIEQKKDTKIEKLKITTQEKILKEIIKTHWITRKILKEKIWNITEDWVKYHIQKLQREWKLKRIWANKWGYWEVIE